MKILHCNTVSTGGGLEQYLYQLFDELTKLGYNNLFLYGENSGEANLPSTIKPFYLEKITHNNCDSLSEKLISVEAIIDQEDPDLIFIHQVLNPSLIDLLTRMKPSIRFMHGFKFVCPEGKKFFKTKLAICPHPLSCLCQPRAFLYQCMPRNPLVGLPVILRSKKILEIHRKRSLVVVASEYMKTTLLNNGFNPDMITVIPYFTHLPDDQIDPVADHEPVIFALGRIVFEKGIHHLLHAFAELRQSARLSIAGDGPAINGLKALVRQLGLSKQVTFLGWLSRETLRHHYRKSTMVVVPSIWPEPFGIVGIEAMAYEKPVVAFNVGGISDWLQDGVTGLLACPGDARDLSQKMSLLLEKPNMAAEMGKMGREVVNNRFIAEVHMNALIPVFNEAIHLFAQGA